MVVRVALRDGDRRISSEMGWISSEMGTDVVVEKVLTFDYSRLKWKDKGTKLPRLAPIAKWKSEFSRTFQFCLDRSTPHITERWLGTLAVAAIYVLRVYLLQGFYIVSYAIGIYMLNLLIGFLSPKIDPELELEYLDEVSLPTRGSDEFKPFIRRLPEYSITKAFCIGFVMTFFSIFDVPVFWPILLFYWIALFVLTMKRQIMHMIKYKYVPFSIGKQKYYGKKTAPTGKSLLTD
ncbi:Protein RER1B [Hibiscus syriacus]|uniref:Protein RER1B n=1 Tax=Hibiscus syriacus TaxID=106335 RepID=A0A6A2Y273_HIBSY|nr:Protein RER1B [Hibiscus syriacus]